MPEIEKETESKLIRVKAKTREILNRFKSSNGEKISMGQLIDEYAERLGKAMDEDCNGASNITIIVFRPVGKANVVVSCLIPEFFGKLNLENLPDDSAFDFDITKINHQKVRKHA